MSEQAKIKLYILQCCSWAKKQPVIMSLADFARVSFRWEDKLWTDRTGRPVSCPSFRQRLGPCCHFNPALQSHSRSASRIWLRSQSTISSSLLTIADIIQLTSLTTSTTQLTPTALRVASPQCWHQGHQGLRAALAQSGPVPAAEFALAKGLPWEADGYG